MTLTKQQIEIIAPDLLQVHEAEQRVVEARSRLYRMLALIEPRMLDPTSGLSFNQNTMSFVEKSD